MPNVTIRDIPDDIFQDIKLFARKERRSFNSQLIVGLSMYVESKKSGTQKLKEIRRLRENIDAKGYSPSQEELKSMIEEGRP